MERMETPKRLVLDTSVMIQLLRGREAEKRLFSSLEEKSIIATTILNVFELYYGAYKSRNPKANLAAVKAFLATIEVLELDDRSAERSGEIMAKLESSGNMLDPRDLFTGCIALENGYAVLTRNQKHFERIPGLLVIEPPDLM